MKRKQWTKATRFAGFLLLLMGLWACPPEDKQDKQKETPEPKAKPSTANPAAPGDGLTAVPTGSKPQTKGDVLNMDLDEMRLILVRPGGPADKAGFKAGDRLLAADGKDLNSDDDLAEALCKAEKKKTFFEVRRGKSVETLPVTENPPGWLMLSGDMFKGFLVSRVRNPPKVKLLDVGSPAAELKLPGYAEDSIHIRAKPDKTTAVLFWGTFGKDGDEILKAFGQTCAAAGDGLHCVVVDTMELFTAVRQTQEYSDELARIHSEVWQGPLAVDLFMRAEHAYGISKLPSLVVIGADGTISARFDGPQKDLAKAFAPLRAQ